MVLFSGIKKNPKPCSMTNKNKSANKKKIIRNNIPK